MSYIIAGVLFGMIGSMGIGGGMLLIPVLTLLMGVLQKEAQMMNLAAFLPMALTALYFHGKNGLLEKKPGMWIIVPGIIGGISGAILAGMTDPGILRKLFGLALTAAGIKTLFRKKTDFEE